MTHGVSGRGCGAPLGLVGLGLPNFLPMGYVTAVRIRGLFFLLLIPMQGLPCSWQVADQRERLYARFPHPPTPRYTLVTYYPLTFHGDEGAWHSGGRVIYHKHFGPRHHFVNGATPKDTEFMVKSVHPQNQELANHYYEPLAPGRFEAEIADYTGQVRKVLRDNETITEKEAREYEVEDGAIPYGRKVLFVFLDESGKAQAVLRLVDYSATPSTYGGPKRMIVPDEWFTMAKEHLGITLDKQVSNGFLRQSAVAPHILAYPFEHKLKHKTLPERQSRFPVPTYLLGRYWISHGTLSSPEPLLVRVAEYLFYKDGFQGGNKLGMIYATATEAGNQVYTDPSPDSPYHFETVFTPQDFLLNEGDTPIYAIRQSVEAFYSRHPGANQITYHYYPRVEEAESPSFIFSE